LTFAFALNADKRARAADLPPNIDAVLPLALAAIANGISILSKSG
jgi:hypothetical protein